MAASEEQLRVPSHAHAGGARRVALGVGGALVLALAVSGAATLGSQLTTNANAAAGMTAMHQPVRNGTLAASAQGPGFDEMVKVCNEHMAAMSSMMQMMQGSGMMRGVSGMMRGVSGMSGGMR